MESPPLWSKTIAVGGEAGGDDVDVHDDVGGDAVRGRDSDVRVAVIVVVGGGNGADVSNGGGGEGAIDGGVDDRCRC